MSSKIVKLNGHKLKADRIVRKLDSILRSIKRLEMIQQKNKIQFSTMTDADEKLGFYEKPNK